MDGFFGDDLRLLGRLGRVMNHRVGVFHTYAIGAGLLLNETHQIVVVLLLGPISLPFEEGWNRCQTDSTRLNHSR